MNFLVMSMADILKFKSPDPYAVISICSLGYDALQLKDDKNRLAILSLQFDNIDKPTDKLQLFSDFHAAMIIGFYNLYKDKVNTIVCQCHAGISRSSAVAAALSKLTGQSDMVYFKKYCPNRYVYGILVREDNK